MPNDLHIPGIPRGALSLALRRLEAFNPTAIYIFGSAVRGGVRPDSDIDIAVLAVRPLDPLAVFTTAGDLEDIFARPVDLLDLRRATTVMAKQVIATGVLVQDSNISLRQEFEMLVFSNYARLNEERQPVFASLGIAVHSP